MYIRILRSGILLLLDARIIFKEYIPYVELSTLPDLRHVREQTKDDVLEPEYRERAPLVKKGLLRLLKRDLVERAQVLPHITVLLLNEDVPLAVGTHVFRRYL